MSTASVERVGRLAVVASLLVAASAWAQPPPDAAVGPPPALPSVPNTEIVPPPPHKGPYLPVPPDASLVADAKPSSNTGIDDRVFRSSWSDADVLRFYDRTLQQRGLDIVSRRAQPDRVTFTVRRPDGRLGSVTVRNTRHPTIETREPI